MLKNNLKKLGIVIFLVILSAMAYAQEPAVPEVPLADVVFMHEMYMDHTQSIIAIEKGWFKDVGISIVPEPYGKIGQTGELVQLFTAGAMDVVSGSAQLLLPSYKNIPSNKFFAIGDLFQGYAIMAQPDQNYKSAQEYIDEGLTPDEAIQKAIQQMVGKKFAYPSEAAIKGFIMLAFNKGKVDLSDVQSIVAEDQKTWAMMIAKEADFQVGGVPSRLTLESKGFKPIVTSFDLAKYAEASPDSEALRAVFYDGWMASDKWISENYDTMLRMASVCWRINKFINENTDEALDIHIPFVNSVAGTEITPEEGKVAYKSLHPFITFEELESIYMDDTNPLNQKYVIGSYIKMYEDAGLFKLDEIKVENVAIDAEVYKKMLEYKNKSDQLYPLIEEKINEAKEKSKDVLKAQELLEKSKYFYNAYDFLDAKIFAESAQEWADYLLKK